jgi:hypothetical protein
MERGRGRGDVAVFKVVDAARAAAADGGGTEVVVAAAKELVAVVQVGKYALGDNGPRQLVFPVEISKL